VNFNRALHDTVQGHSPKTHNEVVEWGSRTLRHVCNQAYPESAMCVQKFDDSRGPAIRITYRISLRSSSLWEPRHPLLKVVHNLVSTEMNDEQHSYLKKSCLVSSL
jgi:hypothetical protein